jgi:alkylated DNA repair protein alkB homolog 1
VRKVERATDFSAVIDLDGRLDPRRVLQCCLPGPIGLSEASDPPPTVYRFVRHPGMFVLRNAMSLQLQRQLVNDCFTAFPCSPAHTNFVRSHGRCLDGLWDAAKAGLRLVEKKHLQEADDAAHIWAEHGQGPPAEQLLRKLRWASIGPVFDWTTREYIAEDGKYLPLPEYLKNFATQVAKLCQELEDRSRQLRLHPQQQYTLSETDGSSGTSIATVDCEDHVQASEYSPDAALVNYYTPGDTLSGHVDDAETNLSKPLVSLSLGCPAVFLMGARNRDVAPTALWLRNGDVVVLVGEARKCYHGVPRVLSMEQAGLEAAERCEFTAFEQHMRSRRINVSIRQVM